MSKENRVNTDGLMRECLKCGSEFIPDESGEECCSDSCASVYYGWNDMDGWNDDDWSDDNELDYNAYDEYYGILEN